MPDTTPAPDDDASTFNLHANTTDASRKPPHLEDLVQTIKEYADKLATDGTSRGDLKVISRTVRELRYAFKVFAPYRKRRKVSVFGSARTPPTDPGYQEAVKLGQAFAAADWMVVTGAAAGIMEAGHVGAGRDASMGLNIMLPFEQSANPVILGDPKLVHMKYFFTRKLMFVKECDAVVCLPGGFGTLDEAMEVITLLQTGKRDMVPVVLLDPPGGGYWPALVDFVNKHLLGGRMISPDDLHLFRVCDDYQTAVDEVLGFFRVYHSMRYVKHELVLRLNQALTPERIDDLNDRYRDILVSGRLELRPALALEHDDPDLLHHPRLVLHFNRRSFGRLRQLINDLNQPS